MPATDARCAALSSRSPRRSRGAARRRLLTTRITCCTSCRTGSCSRTSTTPTRSFDTARALGLVGVRRRQRVDRRRLSGACRRSRHRFRRHTLRSLVRTLRRGRRRAVGEGRDRQPRRLAQGAPSGGHPAPSRSPPSGWACSRTAAAGDRLVRQRRHRRRHPRPAQWTGRSTSTCPIWMSDAVGEPLTRSARAIHRCPRRAEDPPGDPAMLRFRQAVAEGAVPFSVQGPENVLCLEPGARSVGRSPIRSPASIAESDPLAGGGAGGRGSVGGVYGRRVGAVRPARHGAGRGLRAVGRDMGAHPRRGPPRALLDAGDAAVAVDRTRWPTGSSTTRPTTGSPTCRRWSRAVVARSSPPSPTSSRAHEMAVAAGFDVSPTGSAGLAGVLTLTGELQPDDRLLVVMSGVAR